MSQSGPIVWDLAGGHALLRAIGADLYDSRGDLLRYPGLGNGDGSGTVIGGSRELSLEVAGRLGRIDRHSTGSQTPDPATAPSRGPATVRIANPGLLSRAQGCLLGQCAGDALGSLVEFKSAEEIRRRHPNGVRELADGG